MNSKLEALLKLPNTWQASRGPRLQAVIPTGYPQLDQALHQQGWPQAATTELLLEQPGFGELGLLLPGLLARQPLAPWLVMIAPPYQPFAPALVQAGIDLQRLLIVQPRDSKELLWCASQCLASGACSAVLTWSLEQTIRDRDLRRLQQAATAGNCWHLLFRHQREQLQTSPSALRIHLRPETEGQLQLQIIKQRGGWAGQTLMLRPASQPLPQPARQPLYHGPLPDSAALGYEQTSKHGRVSGNGHGLDSPQATRRQASVATLPTAQV